MRTFLLQATPFLISIFVGILIFIVQDVMIAHEGISNVAMGVASGLLSIPIVFLFYQITYNYSEKRVRSVVTEHIIFEMNYVVVQLLKDLKEILRFKPALTKENLYGFLTESMTLEGKHLNFKSAHSVRFGQYKNQILKIMSENPNLNILPGEVIQSILSIAKESGIIAVELKRRRKNRDTIVRTSLENLVEEIDRWIEFCELEAVVSHHTFKWV